MADPLSGGIEAKGVDPQGQFKAASLGTAAQQKPHMTFPVKPQALKEIINNLDSLKGRTADSEVVKETTDSGATKYSFIDTRNNQPLAVMTEQNGQASLSLYKSPAELAKRIDSVFINADSIKEFVAKSRSDVPSETYAFKP
jgi:hypothetical protein